LKLSESSNLKFSFLCTATFKKFFHLIGFIKSAISA